MAKTKIVSMEEVVEEPQVIEETAEVVEETTAEAPAEKKSQPKEKASKKAQKKGKSKVRSKKYQQVLEKIDRSPEYSLDEAVKNAKEASYTKFDGSLEIHINTAVKNIRGLVSLPFASGKKLTVLAFGKGAEDSGADIIGDEKALAEIEKGKVNFDVLVTTPDWMPRLARAARVLGPRGLMPNPKNGTITNDLKKTIAEIQGGKVEYKTEKDRMVIHLSLGKLSQPDQELVENVKTLLSVIGRSKIKKVTLSPTMGPGIKAKFSNI